MEKIEKLNIISGIFEGKIEEEVTLKEKSKAGTWIGDELIIVTYPLNEFINRIIQVGYNFKNAKKMETRLRKILPDLIKNDRNFGRSIIDIMSDKELNSSDKADMIDANVDEFIDSHSSELSLFNQYRRQ